MIRLTKVYRDIVVEKLWHGMAMVIVCCIAMASCSGDTPEQVQPQQADGQPTVETQRRELNILCLGNSYTWDAMLYVPYIMHSIAPDLHMTIGIMCTGGESVENHYKMHMLNNVPYSYYHQCTDAGIWERDSISDLDSIITRVRWDLITMQQVSRKSYVLSSLALLPDCIEWLRTKNPTTKIGWIVTPSYPDGCPRLPGPDASGAITGFNTSDEMFAGILDCATQITDKDIDLFFPVGTAIQHARHTELATLGTFGCLSNDGIHLQDGLPRTLAAMVVCATLINYYKIPGDIGLNTFVISNSFRKQHFAPILPAGSIVNYDKTQLILMLRCVDAALSSPFQFNQIDE